MRVTGTVPLSGDAQLAELIADMRREIAELQRAVAAGSVSTWHSVGAVGEPAFQNSWTNFGGGFAPARFQLRNGRVYLDGLIKSGTLTTTAFTLPVGYRPTTGGDRVFGPHTGGAAGRVDVQLDGDVVVQGSNNGYVSLQLDFPVD